MDFFPHACPVVNKLTLEFIHEILKKSSEHLNSKNVPSVLQSPFRSWLADSLMPEKYSEK